MQLPANIGKYELLEFLGGGMSQVYRARDTVIDRPVVVKILTLEGSADPEAKARFLQEARVAGNIQHENIVSVFDFGEHEGRPFIVMEYLKGEDLRDRAARRNAEGRGQWRAEGLPQNRASDRRLRSNTCTRWEWCIATSSRRTSTWIDPARPN